MTKMFDLTGRVAAVTGAARGMGRSMATAFAEAGADVVLLDLNAGGAEATAADLRKLGRRVLPIVGDVTDIAHIDRIFATIDKEFGRIDILGNVAGAARMGPAESMSLDDIRYTFHNLVISRYYTCQHAGRRMLAQGRGSIISIGSIAGDRSLWRNQSVYGMAMAAVMHMTKELSTEWSGRGVRVNCVVPAQVPGENELNTRMAADPYLKDTFLYGIPRGRFGVPDDIKGLAVFLASDAADWITGACIPMDGGNMAKNGGGGLLAPVIGKYVTK
ncbi:MAG: SDR family oxidoreductase [Alphaproteobacteria bacterium]|nr:SDR family oxidoreductase [Alphaproteobacteria bacterium]